MEYDGQGEEELISHSLKMGKEINQFFTDAVFLFGGLLLFKT